MAVVHYYLCFLFLAVVCEASFSQGKSPVRFVTVKTPFGFESEINEFLKQDSVSFPLPGAHLFTGSSTIRKWASLQNDFNGITVIQRGFGGSTVKALNYYADRIVFPYKPATIVVYEGDNDLAQGMAPGEFISLCDTFIGKVRAALPGTTIYFMSVKPSFARKQLISVQDETNRHLKKLAKKRKRTEFMDIRQLMYDREGKLRRDFFEADSLHVNRKCYSVWAGYMKTKMGFGK
jgi:hypothetical protein